MEDELEDELEEELDDGLDDGLETEELELEPEEERLDSLEFFDPTQEDIPRAAIIPRLKIESFNKDGFFFISGFLLQKSQI